MRRVCFLLMLSMAATLLAGAVFAADPPVPTPVPTVVEGNITAIVLASATTAKITVQPPQVAGSTLVRPPVTFLVNASTKIFKDGKEAKLAALVLGDACRAQVIKTREGSLLAQIVYATTVIPPIKTVNGTITEKQSSTALGPDFQAP